MRTRSCTVGLAALLGSFCFVALSSPAQAAPKKKKHAPAAERGTAPADGKSVDDLMQESSSSSKKKQKPVASPASESSAASESPADEVPVGEPDAWEKPPMDEEKPPPPPAKVVEKAYGDGRRIELGLALGYGFKAGDADWTGLNPYSLGLGVRGGYEFDFKMFLGAGFIYHLGTSESRNGAIGVGQTPIFEDVAVNYMLAYAEVGYDLWFDSWMLRPSMWLGMGFAVADPYTTSGVTRTVQDVLLAPGVSLNYVFDGLYFGVDVRYVAVTADGLAGLNFYGIFGLRLS